MDKSSNEVIFEKLIKVRTSNQWSLLSAVARRINVKENELVSYLKSIDIEVLKNNGIWIEKQGHSYIICTNPACRLAIQNNSECDCILKDDKSLQRYFGSNDYNAGRHAKQNGSSHKTSCKYWNPPSSGHLQSWRRGY